MYENLRYRQLLLAFILLAGTYFTSFAQGQNPITINGTVTDTTGRRMEGVSVTNVQRTGSGTSTDQNGRFILDVIPNTSLRFSYVGFNEVVLTVYDTTRIMNVVMVPNRIQQTDTVVITAFGKRERKEAIVGSVSTIQPGELKIPSSNLTNALAGKVAGIISFQRSGQPGQDNSQFFIRGVTTLGYSSSPLILIDNIELTANDLARLQVDDIASFSILKDASAAALYGARGANGVILVTTKEGKQGKAKVDIRLETSISSPTKNLELADPVTYMKLYNEALATRPRSGSFQAPYTPDKIMGTAAVLNNAPGNNPLLYPAVDWMETLFKKQTTTNRANFSVGGGSPLARYYIAGSYSRDNGILQVNKINNFNSGMKYENYQLRGNMNVKITPTTEVVVRLWGNFNDYTGPITSNNGGLATDLYFKALRSSPVDFLPYYPADSSTALANHILFGNSKERGSLQRNPYADLMYGYKSSSESRMSAQFELNQNLSFITRGLNFRGLFSTNRYSYFDLTRSYKPFYYSVDKSVNDYRLIWLNNLPGEAQEFLDYAEGPKYTESFVYLQGALDYNRSFGRHNISSVLIGTRQQTLKGNAGSVAASLPFRNLGISGRLSYAFDNRYFIEGNFGYNGSERFAPDHRWGFFPTVGAGWVISNEKFWDGKISNIITRLKLRGSYGLVGNDAIGNPNNQRFFYLSSVRVRGGPGATFGNTNGVTMNGTSIQAYPNPDITWETGKKSNVAIEMTLFKNLSLTAEAYYEYRYDIAIPRGYIPVTAGIESTAQGSLLANLGTVRAKGIDFNLNYKQNFGKDLWIEMMGNLTLTSNKVGNYEEPEYRYAYRFISGRPVNQVFGYIAERLFVDDKEAANSPNQSFGGPMPQGGDIKYRDVNKDGVINQDDQVALGLPTTPQVIYGFGFSVGYKNFDLNAFFQGLARESFFVNPTSQFDTYYNVYGTAPFVNDAQILKAYADSHWSEENQDIYAMWPRLSLTDLPNNQQQSSWWLRDGSFMRLKSIEVGYTFPKRWTRKAFLDGARLYFNGLNLFTFSRFKLWDPEQGGNGFAYPIQKIVNLGLKLNF